MSATSAEQRDRFVRHLRTAEIQNLVLSGNRADDPLSGALAHARMRAHRICDGRMTASMARTRTTKKVTCEDCFFCRNQLCAMERDEPCTTYRPDSPEGLKPPQQLRFSFRQERRVQAAWAFPSAQEQAALHGALTR